MTYVSTQHLASTCQDDPSINRMQYTIANLAYSIGNLLQCVSRRRHLKTLGQLSDQQLSDIGLNRDDIFETAKLGYHRDVTCHLAGIARRRRQNFVRPVVCDHR